ncbi:MAG: hypothetical protein HDS43_08280 [Bacteroides sp.]|nr:hypothetical protein [Bacteroides sp.]
MKTIIAIHNESEYKDILRQAVAVIETARNKVARAIAGSSNEIHWNPYESPYNVDYQA